MQQKSYQLIHQGLGVIPLVNHFIEEVELHKLLKDFCKHPRYSDAILLLVKNVMIERHALYAIHDRADLLRMIPLREHWIGYLK